jgi:hypothetical protein
MRGLRCSRCQTRPISQTDGRSSPPFRPRVPIMG